MTRLFPGWRVVADAGCGIAFGSVIFVNAAFPQLAAVWGHDFNWSQPQLAKAASIYLLMQMVASPIIGWFLDRWGSRKVACASIAMLALVLLAVSRLTDSLLQMYVTFALLGLLTAGTNVVSYARAISLWFDRKRGLALGLAASSQAVGAVLLPLVAARLIATSGWSSAVVALAVFELVVCLPLVALLVKDSPVPFGLLPDGAETSADARAAVVFGPTPREIARSPIFWKLVIAFVAMGLTFYAISINIVYILTRTASMPVQQIATVQAIGGAAVLLGRLGFGYLLDKLHAPLVAVLAIAMTAAGTLLYANATATMPIILAALLIGASVGGESDLMPYLAGRYFGTRSLSTVFGWFLAAFFVGGAIGPSLFAGFADAQGSVPNALYGLLALQLLPLAVFLTLGRYPVFGHASSTLETQPS